VYGDFHVTADVQHACAIPALRYLTSVLTSTFPPRKRQSGSLQFEKSAADHYPMPSHGRQLKRGRSEARRNFSQRFPVKPSRKLAGPMDGFGDFLGVTSPL